jgi:hypothetical protein
MKVAIRQKTIILKMKDDARELVETIQSIMVESAEDTFEKPALGHLRCLVRLTVEFHDYLQNGQPELGEKMKRTKHYKFSPEQIKQNELSYTIDSIFAGIDSFLSVNANYSVLVGATKSGVHLGIVSESSLQEQFNAIFHEFTKEKQFEKQCRLLLDLFKIQIVFAGVFFD